MDKLNELVERAKNARFDDAYALVNPSDILAIAEAFRELEQRAEAAEMQLADKVELIYSMEQTIYRYSGPAPAAVPVDVKALEDITAIAHHGGLANLDAAGALKLIRRVTLPYFNPSISDDEVLRRIEELK